MVFDLVVYIFHSHVYLEINSLFEIVTTFYLGLTAPF